MKAKRQNSPTPSTNTDWKVPDWRKRDAYPKEGEIGLTQWRWEFLRRREDYRKDWLEYSQKSYEKEKEEYKKNPNLEIPMYTKKNGQQRIIRLGKKDKPLPPEHLHYTASMPNAYEKYGMVFLLDPRTPSDPPTEEFWTFVKYSPIERVVPKGGLFTDVFGLSMSLLETEVALRFNLSRQPIGEQMAEFLGIWPHDVILSDSPIEIQHFKSFAEEVLWISNIKLKNTSDIRWKHFKKIQLIKNPHHHPRFIQHPHDKDLLIAILDLKYAFNPQWDCVKTELVALQNDRFPNFKNRKKRRARPDAWTDYLRVLDAKEAGATQEDIGKTVYDCEYDYHAGGQASKALKDAKRIQYDFPY